MNTFSAGAMIRAGWQTFTKRAWFFIASFLLVTIIEIVLNQALHELVKLGAAAGVIGVIGSFVVDILYGMGVVNFSLKAAENPESAQLRDYWHPYPFWNFVGASLLMAACVVLAILGSVVVGGILSGIAYLISSSFATPVFVVVSVVLAVISAVYLAVLFIFSRYLVVDRNLGPVDSLKESMRITAGRRGELFLFLVLCVIIAIVGFICLVVGIFVAVPVLAFAKVHAYRTLSQQASEPVPAAAM